MEPSPATYEVVHTTDDYYDGIRSGIADYFGEPHVFESNFNDLGTDEPPMYRLRAIDHDTFVLAMEAWAIWLRWERAFHRGEVADTSKPHPALPEDEPRHRQLEELLGPRLLVPADSRVLAWGEFRPRQDPTWDGIGWARFEVHWTPCGVQSAGEAT